MTKPLPCPIPRLLARYGGIAVSFSLVLAAASSCRTLDQTRTAGRSSCTVDLQPDGAPARPSYAHDPHSFARPNEVSIDHIGLEWDVDFDSKTLRGRALLAIDRHDPLKPLTLDTRDLIIEAVFTASSANPDARPELPRLVLEDNALTWTPANWQLGEPVEHFGAAMTVDLPPSADLVEIRYRTRASASGLQWLNARQTESRVAPFMYSQSQSIHARSWIPCQDTPGVRVTYDARVRVPEGQVAVMSAEMLTPVDRARRTKFGQREFDFIMPQAVPAYLLAIGVGHLARAELGPRSAVWADPKVLARAAHEFGGIEEMMVKAEELFGPYRWGRYDLLVLPPAFPMGGMENPRLTFATPTILAGDRSLIALVAHELAHSWSGNLVTNSTWGDLWLNEGFTVYFERRIIEAIYGPERAQMEAMLGRQDLDRSLAALADRPAEQALYIDPEGRDPEEMFSDVAYEKGALFLQAIEEAYGRERFDPFLKAWFDEHGFHSVSTAEFVDFLRIRLIEAAEPLAGKQVPDLKAWIYGTGETLPPGAPQPQSDGLSRVDQQIAALRSGAAASTLDTSGWTPHQWLHFLRGLTADVDVARMTQLDAAFQFTQSGNSEIVAQWLTMSAKVDYPGARARMQQFLTSVGRRKFLMPIYRALMAHPQGAARAREIYKQARPGYHAISQRSLDALITPPGSDVSTLGSY